jgi:tRNA (mo5U34)-methyltransferase
MTQAELEEMNQIRWFHKLTLAPGVVTPGMVDHSLHESSYFFPQRFNGESVLDIGAWDGYYTFQAERRGAGRVVAVDDPSQRHAGTAGFEFAKKILRSQAQLVISNVYDLSQDKVGTFDVVLFYGVLYHLRHPLLGLERVAEVCKDRLLLETHVIPGEQPVMRFYPGSELNNDPTNWWGPTVSCTCLMLESLGFEILRTKTWDRDRHVDRMAVECRKRR